MGSSSTALGFHTSHWNTAALATPHTPPQRSHVNHNLHYQFNTTPLAPSPIQHSQPRNTVATIYSKDDPKGQRLSSCGSSGKHLQSTRCHLASRQPQWKNNRPTNSTTQHSVSLGNGTYIWGCPKQTSGVRFHHGRRSSLPRRQWSTRSRFRTGCGPCKAAAQARFVLVKRWKQWNAS